MIEQLACELTRVLGACFARQRLESAFDLTADVMGEHEWGIAVRERRDDVLDAARLQIPGKLFRYEVLVKPPLHPTSHSRRLPQVPAES